MKEILAYAGGVLLLLCSVPYIADIVKGKTKPNIVTWFTWTVLNGIGAAALFASHQTNAALLLCGDLIGTSSVVMFGLKYGKAKLDRFDVFCQIGAVVGLVLWILFSSPLIAIIATVSIDIIGTVPTLRHAWRHPEEETALTFLVGIVATILTILSLKDHSFSGWVYPVYLLLSNTLLYLTISRGLTKR